MDWDSLERRNLNKKPDNDKAAFKIEPKRVAVTKDQIKRLPDGTVIIVDKPKSTDK